MITIGITGGVGSGKSMVMDYLESKWGAVCIRLDDVARPLTDQGGECYDEVLGLFGDGILRDDGTLDRGAMADIVFRDDEMRRRLNSVIHPRVMDRTKEMLTRERAKGTRICAIESAILIEAGYRAICDEMWYIYAGEATRYSRLRESRGYSSERIFGVFDTQLGEEEYRAGTDMVVDNDGGFEKAAEQIDNRIAALAP